jgi:hypothetical protein
VARDSIEMHRCPRVSLTLNLSYDPISLSLPGLTGQSSNPCAIDVFETLPHRGFGGYWIARSSQAMTVGFMRAANGPSDGFALTRTGTTSKLTPVNARWSAICLSCIL